MADRRHTEGEEGRALRLGDHCEVKIDAALHVVVIGSEVSVVGAATVRTRLEAVQLIAVLSDSIARGILR